LNNLAVVYTQQGRAQEALQLLQAAVMAAPTYAEAYNNLGVLQVRGDIYQPYMAVQA
jgi:Flp pilus assembly protein TadD